jgi:hypothetical protein
MSEQIQKFIDLLRSEVGYSEQGSGYTKFGAWYGKTVEFDSDYSAQPWCDMFLSWGARQLGYQEWVGQFAYTPDHAKWFVKEGAWGHEPQTGALVFYAWSGSKNLDDIDHVGIVTKVDGSTIHTIEGNIDGGIAKQKVRDQTYVVGYGYPEKIRERMQTTAKAAAAGPGKVVKAAALDARNVVGDKALPVTAAISVNPHGVTAISAFPTPQLPVAGAPLLVTPLLLAALALAVRVRRRGQARRRP